MQEDLGFKFTQRQQAFEIYHRGVKATVLRGARAREFEEELKGLSFSDQQQLMARLTGNYKRGNERLAKNHPRNCAQ